MGKIEQNPNLSRAAMTQRRSTTNAVSPPEKISAEPEPPRPDVAADGAPTPKPAGVGEATPSMAQYLEIKAANPDCVLWYRMGDFYELFFEDAVVVSAALGIVLTKRGKHLGQDIPMCGVPVVRADEYLQRLIRQGYRVAVCEQLEDPAEARKRGSKAVVKRDVVRLVTPGTLTEDTLLDAKARNYLTALFRAPGAASPLTPPHHGEGKKSPAAAEFAVASLDLSTGEMEVGLVGRADLGSEIVRLSPSELIASDDVLADEDVAKWIGIVRAAGTPVPGASFDSMAGERNLKAALGVSDLEAFGAFSRPELAAIAALLKYVELTQIGRKPMLRPPRRTGAGSVLVIDAASRASLEILRSTSGEKSGSLVAALDRTVTGAGARELAARLSSPLTDPHAINARLDAVGFLIEREALREDLRAALKAAPDIARALARLALQRGGPRDLGAVRDAIEQGQTCAELLVTASRGIGLPGELASAVERIRSASPQLGAVLSRALGDELPHVRRDGGFVRSGFKPELDEARQLAEDSRKVMAALEAKYVEETGVKTLKVRHNNILGYFIEVTQLNAKPLLSPPISEKFRHKQTMSNAMRFTTQELTEIEGRIASAGERALSLEQEIFAELAGAVAAQEQQLIGLAAALAEIDLNAGLAELAAGESYVRPIVDASLAFEIRGGRHPVVEQALRAAKSGPFIENDCVLVEIANYETEVPAAPGLARAPGFEEAAKGRVWLVTGPNMAGKSTFLRQNALIALMAQAGSYVPARAARIGAVDRLFSRVGASDDLARGRSTFMVEMVETAAILNQATERSLVILDEIGRGTATFDGLSIAWATLEYLHDKCGARALFATHYHELTQLTSRLSSLACATMDVKEWQDEIVFLHRVRPGIADRSYGIQVAKLAGLPAKVIARAGEVLRRLEKQGRKSSGAEQVLEDLPLFAASQPQPASESDVAREPDPVHVLIDSTSADELSPRAALELIYKLKELRSRERSAHGETSARKAKP
jgi:DNA mismatch repair protein MutS